MAVKRTVVFSSVLGAALLAGCGSSTTTPTGAASSSQPAVSAPSTVPASSAPSVSASASSCGSLVKSWYLASGATETADVHAAAVNLIADEKAGADSMIVAQGGSVMAAAQLAGQAPIPACGDTAQDWAPMVAHYSQAGKYAQRLSIAQSQSEMTAGAADLATVNAEISKFTPLITPRT
jgi:hypothetical protein